MVTVTVEWGGGKMPTTLKATGHAGYGQGGTDVVCAALSALFYTAAHAVEGWEQQKKLLEPPTLTLGEGFGEITFLPKPQFAHTAQIALQTVVGGIGLLSQYYPRYLRLSEF